ncbi:Six-hairpin glycosidase [Hymenopellis radicata]|nr:Six-hairpin glycosidase [Hymenopellis radicata]
MDHGDKIRAGFSTVLLSSIFPLKHDEETRSLLQRMYSARFLRPSCWAWLVIMLSTARVSSESLTGDQLNAVKDRLAEAAQQSWEFGTRAQALLEYDARTYSVFSGTSLPPPSTVTDTTDGLTAVFDMAEAIVSDRASSNGNINGSQPLMNDGSAADPASNGVSVLLANWTGQGNLDYAGAAQDQLDYLLNNVSRSSDGAISHRVSQVQLWSDFVYMVPPFLAYYGVLTSNESLVSEAYNQIKLYRDHLRDTDANNLWKHVMLGRGGIDEGHWSTGNGWAAAGMLRVLATIQNSEFDGSFSDQKDDLASWTLEIHSAMYNVIDDTSIFRNYADNGTTFYDSASTALMAATVYRLSSRKALYASGTTSSFSPTSTTSGAFPSSTVPSGLQHFTADGWLTPVVNPHSYGVEGSESAEGQAFVLMMQAAYQDWVDDGSPGNDGLRLRSSSWCTVIALGLVMAALL